MSMSRRDRERIIGGPDSRKAIDDAFYAHKPGGEVVNEQEDVDAAVEKLFGPQALEERVKLLEAAVKRLTAEIARLKKQQQPMHVPDHLSPPSPRVYR